MVETSRTSISPREPSIRPTSRNSGASPVQAAEGLSSGQARAEPSGAGCPGAPFLLGTRQMGASRTTALLTPKGEGSETLSLGFVPLKRADAQPDVARTVDLPYVHHLLQGSCQVLAAYAPAGERETGVTGRPQIFFCISFTARRHRDSIRSVTNLRSPSNKNIPPSLKPP
ncbi:hypothetical protein E2320_013234 [Naja naja]|nr:hypothetical protein E2320_013234 [Naja naja]